MSVEIYNANCMELMNTLDDNSVDLFITDPPYKTTARGNSGGTGGILKDKNFIKGNGGFKHNDLRISDYMPEVKRIMKEGAHGYIMCNDKNLSEFLSYLPIIGLNVFKTLIWAKDNCVTNMYYMSSHEYIIFFRKGKAKKINECGTRSVLNIKNVRNKLHPSQKPIELMEVLIKNSSLEGDTIFDPFMGVGSAGIACVNLKRNFVGFEIDESYFQIAHGRLKEQE